MKKRSTKNKLVYRRFIRTRRGKKIDAAKYGFTAGWVTTEKKKKVEIPSFDLGGVFDGKNIRDMIYE